MEVVNINKDKQKSEHDKMWKGKAVHLDIIHYSDGFMAAYYIDTTVSPFPGLEIPQKKSLVKKFIKRNWWHKMVRTKDEVLVDKAVRGLKERWGVMKKNTDRFDSILEKYGVGDEETPGR